MKINISYGEFIDRFTILVNKVYNCVNGKDVTNAMKELIELSTCYQEKPLRTGEAELRDRLIWQLKHINRCLWEKEELVRQEINDKSRLQLSDDIRELNKQRSEKKKALNVIHFDRVEVKDYATTKM